MTLLAELRYAVRRLIRAPAFSIVAVATLAIGIGANTAIFGLVDAVLLRSLPYPEPDRLVMAWQDYTERGGPPDEWFSPANYLDWRDELEGFAALGAFTGWGPTLVDDGEASALSGGRVSHDFFAALGARPALGRLFRAHEDLPGGGNVVVLGHGLWEGRFGADPDVVGRTLRLGGESFQVVGVLEPGFDFPLLPGVDVLAPLQLDPAGASRGAVFLRVVGRLAPGVSLEAAEAQAETLSRRLAAEYPDYNMGVGATLEPLRERLVGDVRLGLLVLFGGVGAVLLIACVNLATLLLARAGQRRRESALRAALGAGAFRIARLQLAESGLLALGGAAGGLLVAVWLMELLVTASPLGLPTIFQPALDWRVVAFTAGLAALTAVGFGFVPAIRAARPDLVSGLKEGGRGGSARGRGRSALVVAQLAFALILLVAAGLLTRSFLALQSVDPGFEPAGVLTFQLFLPSTTVPESEQVAAFYRDLIDRVEALPGVERAAAVSNIPFGGGGTDVSFVIEGEPAPGPGQEKVVWYRQMTPDFLETMRIPVLSGRGIEPTDRYGAPSVVLLSEVAAERFFPGEDPVGRRIKPGSDPDADQAWLTIIGVVGGVHHSDLSGAPRIEMYLPHEQWPSRGVAVVARTQLGDPAALAPAVRDVIREIEPTLAVSNLSTFDALIGRSVALERFLTLCIGTFAFLALLLASIGVYGVISQLVGQRTRELGIRMALGADRASVLGMVLRQGAALVAVGAFIGLLAAYAVARGIRGLLFDVAPLDPVTFLALPLALAAVALAATYLPARRAAGLDPVTALRTE